MSGGLDGCSCFISPPCTYCMSFGDPDYVEWVDDEDRSEGEHEAGPELLVERIQDDWSWVVTFDGREIKGLCDTRKKSKLAAVEATGEVRFA